MGEKQEKENKNEGGEKKTEGGGGGVTVVLKFDMHCEGCAKKVRKSLRNFPGVESVKTDCSTNKLVVTGKVDPLKIKEKVEEKMKKSVELVSPQPTKGAAKEGGNGGGGAGEKKSENKKPEEKKLEEKKDKEKEKPKEAQVTTLQFKTRVHCDGCAHKIKRIVGKFEGVQEVNVDLAKDLITVKGTMNPKDLLPYLNLKLKRNVDLAPAKKDDGGGKEGGGGQEKPKQGGDKTDKPKEVNGDASTSKENTTNIEVNKLEYSPFSYDYGYSHAYDPRLQGVGYAHAYDPRPQGEGYGHQVPPYWHAPDQSHPPQMFSDENPNACSVM